MKEDTEARFINKRMKLEENLKFYTQAIGEKSGSIGTAALLVGGILVVGYIVGRKFLLPGKEKRSESHSSDPSTYLMRTSPKHELAIIRMIKEQMVLFIIIVLREKLRAYINSADNNKK